MYGPLLILLVLIIQEIFLLVLVHSLDRGVQAEDVLVLVFLLPFVEAFQRRFEWLYVLSSTSPSSNDAGRLSAAVSSSLREGRRRDRGLSGAAGSGGTTPKS
jgi:hypothetical protein